MTQAEQRRSLPGGGAVLSRRGLLVLGALVAAGCRGESLVDRSRAGAARGAAARALAWLATQQSADGRFPSTTYGLLKTGQSTTPFVVASVLQLPPKLRDDAVLRKALRSLVGLQTGGALGFATVAPDYPTYSTALALSGWAALPAEATEVAAATALVWLLDQQYGPGWSGHPAEGGWGMGALKAPSPPHAGHVDLSMTRRVLQALAAARLAPGHEAFVRARSFVQRCRAGAGFVYSPVDLALNKGGCDGACAPYGSATTDGILASAVLGLDPTEPLAWLRAHHRLDANPGIGPGPLQGFAQAMRGCYRAGSAEVFAALGGPPGWREALVDAVLAEQRPDGSWVNESSLQKEDDPLISTSFAITCLARACWTAGVG